MANLMLYLTKLRARARVAVAELKSRDSNVSNESEYRDYVVHVTLPSGV